jgi:hypothetical protein
MLQQKDIPKRLLKILGEEGLTFYAAAKLISDKTGVNMSTQQMESMTLRSGFGVDKLLLFVHTFDQYSVEWIVTGQGSMKKKPLELALDKSGKKLEELEQEVVKYRKLLDELDLIDLREVIVLKNQLAEMKLKTVGQQLKEQETEHLKKENKRLLKQNETLNKLLSKLAQEHK